MKHSIVQTDMQSPNQAGDGAERALLTSEQESTEPQGECTGQVQSCSSASMLKCIRMVPGFSTSAR